MAGLVPATHVLASAFGMSDLHFVLGIDAAWTPNGSSGIALLHMTTRLRLDWLALSDAIRHSLR